MRRVKVGDAVAGNVVFNATDLSISGPCIEDIDARNVQSLTGMVDLSHCPRLRKALFGGCPNCSIMLPAGSRVNEVSFPDSMTTLFLHSLVYLTDGNLSIPSSALSTISSFYFENCPNINPLEILDDILGEDPNSLAYVTIILNGTVDVTGAQVEALYKLATGDYGRLVYENGTVSPSVVRGALVQGTIQTTGMYQRQYDAIHTAFPDLTIITDKVYVEFEDQEVWRICCTNWGDYDEVVTTIDSNAGTTTVVTTPVSMLNTTVASRGVPVTVTRPTREGDTAGTVKVPVGITTTQCAAVSSLGTVFNRNAVITKFNELQYFTGLSSLANYVFQNCSSLTSVYLPSTLRSLPDYAFYGCSGLKRINSTTDGVFNVPSGITSFGRCAFQSCSGMEILSISPDTTSLGSQIFTSCSNLKSINSDTEGVVNIPNNITVIGDLFFECRKIVAVYISPNTTSLSGTFTRSSGMKRLNSETDGVFNLPDTLTNIGNTTFYQTLVESIVIPSGVTNIGQRVFDSCSRLTSVTVLRTTPPTLGSTAFPNNSGLIIRVPAESVNTYKSASGWSSYASRIQAIP